MTLLILKSNAHAQIIDSLMQSEFDLEDLLNIEVVTASRSAQKASKASANIIVITSEMIQQRGYRTLTEVFEDVPGFDFYTHQPSGEYPAHFALRGISDVGQTKTLIMVDGIIRNDISNGWARNIGYNFTFTDVERIEIISGPGSALYGANAYTGLINIITKKLDNENKKVFEAKFTYGVNNTIVPEFFTGYKLENGLKLQLAGRLYFTDGDGGIIRPDAGNYFHNNFEPDSILTTEYGKIVNDRNSDGSRKKIPDGFKTNINDIMLRGRIQKNGFTLGFSYWDKKEGLGSEIPGYEYFCNTNALDYSVHHAGNTIFTSYNFDVNDKISSKSLLYHRNTRILPQTGFVYTYKYQSVNNGINPAVVDKKKAYHGEGFATRFEQQFNVNVSENDDLILGFHLARRNEQYFGISLGDEQKSNSTIVSSTYTNEDNSVQPMYFSHNAAFFFQSEQLIKDNYIFTGGLRYDVDSEYGNILNPRLAFVGNLSNNLDFKLLYGHAYKAPTIFELFDEWRGNENLKPQKIGTSEIELSYMYSDNINLKGNYFYSTLKNLIIEATNPDPQKVLIGPSGEHASYFQNIGSTNISGIGLTGDIILKNNLSFSMNYLLTLGENGKEIESISKHKANFILNFLVEKKLNINLRANYRGKVKAPLSNKYFYPKTQSSITEAGYDYMTKDSPDGYMDSIFLLNLSITGKNLFKTKINIEPQLIIRNLLNRDYMGIGRQSGSGVRPVDEIQPQIHNPLGFIPAYHPQPGQEIFFNLKFIF